MERPTLPERPVVSPRNLEAPGKKPLPCTPLRELADESFEDARKQHWFSARTISPAASLDATDHGTAQSVLCKLTPTCSSVVFGNLKRERVESANDLALLDKADLRDLGLSMSERNRVLAWAKEFQQYVDGDTAYPLSDPLTPEVALCRQSTSLGEEDMASRLARSLAGTDVTRRLDEVEKDADFWCRLASSLESVQTYTDGDPKDLRESVLEKLYDFTPARLAEVYSSVSGRSTLAPFDLRSGLEKFGLVGLSDNELQQVLQRTTGSADGSISEVEFEAILSRLKLAQLLKEGCWPTQSSRVVPVTIAAVLSGSTSGCGQLSLVDYHPHGATHKENIRGKEVADFFFGHREHRKGGVVRWAHLSGFNGSDVRLMLALTVKYCLHPLAVEDVFEQSAMKMDRYGYHYFATVEQLCLKGNVSPANPVVVHGRHISIFCAGPPMFDTVITVVQPDKSFAHDWPGGVWRDRRPSTVSAGGMTPGGAVGPGDDDHSAADRWVAKLRERLIAPRSRARERAADFLMYQIVDLVADDYVAVTRAYMARLLVLENELSTDADRHRSMTSDWVSEVTCAKHQLAVVARRIRAFHRMVTRLKNDLGLSAHLTDYLEDVLDNLNEAHEDGLHQAERCSALQAAYERDMDKRQAAHEREEARIAREMRQQQDRQAERMNRTLFVLTVATTVFAPVQFLAAVYGMNFVDANGKPNIPELLWPHGYLVFWIVIAVYLTATLLITLWLYRRVNAKKRVPPAVGAQEGYRSLGGTPSPVRSEDTGESQDTVV